MNRLLPLFLFLSFFAAAQQRSVFFEHIGMEAGLSHPDVAALYRDSRGFLWIGTMGGGLHRYDGYEMKVFQHRDGDSLSLCDNGIASILEDEKGWLWVGTNGGVSYFNPATGKCRNFTQQNGLLSYNFGNCPFQDQNGNIWTNSSGLSRYDPASQRFIRHPISDSLTTDSHVAFDKAGKLWLGGFGGLKMLDLTTGKVEKFLPYPDEKLPEANGVRVRIDNSGNIWAKTWGGGLTRFDPIKQKFEKFIWTPLPRLDGFHNIARDVTETFDARGQRSFWLATDLGVYRFPMDAKDFPSLQKPHDLYNVNSGEGLSFGIPSLFLPDKQGNLWCGSGNGLYRYNTRQDNFQLLKKVIKSPIQKISFTQKGEALLSGIGDPFVLLDTQLTPKKTRIRFPANLHPLHSHISWDAAKDEESGIIYIGTFDGLAAYNEKTAATRWYPYREGDSTGLIREKVTNIQPLGNGKLLLGFWKRKMQIFDVKSGKSIKILGETSYIIRKVKKLQDGNIWICGEGRLMQFDPQKEELVNVTPTPELVYWDLLTDQKKRTWLATNRGLYRFDTDGHRLLAKYGTQHGLPSEILTSICEDKLGRLWLNTELGICYFNPETEKCYTLGQADGLMYNNTGGAMSQDPDGRIWLGFNTDIQIFQPELIKTPPPAQCYITGLKINEKDTLPEVPFERIPEIRLLPGQNALTFIYTAIDLESLGETRFLYRLEGLQTEWVQAGKNRIASFVNLPAGEYVFRVRPEDAGDDATWDAALRVVVTNHFWQRAWFKNLMILLAIALVSGAAAYYYRSQLRLQTAEAKRREAIESTRSQIAQDIHDDLGTDLSKISMGATVAAMMPDLDGDALRDKLRNIGTDAQEVAQHLRDIVFITNPRFDAFSEVQAYFREKSREFLENVGLEAQFDFPKPAQNPSVPPESKRQLFLLLRECLNNTAKHAGATTLNLSFRLSENLYTLEIQDNGRGFDLENTRHFGNGLAGMAARAEKIGAKLKIETAPGQGTVIRLVGRL